MYIIWQGKASYSAVKRSLYAEILYTTGDADSGNILCDDSCKCCTADANVYNFKISTNLKAKKNNIWLICFCTQCYTSNRKKKTELNKTSFHKTKLKAAKHQIFGGKDK